MNDLDLKAPRLIDVLRKTSLSFASEWAYIGPDAKVTWAQRQQRVNAVASAMIALGVSAGEHVGILLGNSNDWIDVFFAAASIGAVTVPINTRFKTEELAYCLEHSDVKYLFYREEFLGIDFAKMLLEIDPLMGQVGKSKRCPHLQHLIAVHPNSSTPVIQGAMCFDDFLHMAGKTSPALLSSKMQAVRSDDVMLMQFTSGTTSYPKGVMLTQANMLLNASAVAKRMGIKSLDRYFSIRPFFHVAGSTLSILVSLNSGCTLLTLPKFDVQENLRVLHEEKCTFISGNDTIFLSLMGHPDFDAKRLHLTGGWAAADAEVMQSIHDVMNIKSICNAYGQSEASPNVLFSHRDDAFELRKSGFAKPLPGVSVRLMAQDEPVSTTDEPMVGEIQVKGWNVMKGYYKKPEETHLAFTHDGWLKTGDLGQADGQGHFRMIGRLKDIFRVGGENVAPSDVEAVLHAHPFVQQSQVIGVPDLRLGEVCAAFVILKPNTVVSESELIQWCAQRCAQFKVPRHLALVQSFEHIGMTGSSKIQKNKLREFAIEQFGLKSKAI